MGRRWLGALAVVVLFGCGGGEAHDAGSDLGTDAADAGSTDAGTSDAPDDSGDCTTDADGDGHRAAECGGDDCDDADANAYPGNTESCDASGHDEDCDATTLGPDRDGDGAVGDACCQRGPGGSMRCGDDCDDMRATVNATALEVCDGYDDDCDGLIDEDVSLTFYRDVDGDGFGTDTMTMVGCSAGSGFVVTSGDCDDAQPSVHPGAADGPTIACNARDDDCDGVIDAGCACTGAMTRPCGPGDGAGGILTTPPCRGGTQMCVAGAWPSDPMDCAGAVFPTTETCNLVDDDCDGVVDDGTTITCWRDVDDDGYAASGATTSAVCPDASRPALGSCPAGFTDRAPAAGTDCDDAAPTRHPGVTEVCDGTDDDCDGVIDGVTGCPCPGVTASPMGFGGNLTVDIPRVVNGLTFTYRGVDASGHGVTDVACASRGYPIVTGVLVTAGVACLACVDDPVDHVSIDITAPTVTTVREYLSMTFHAI